MFVIVAIITLKVWIVPYICFNSLIPRTVLSNQEDGGILEGWRQCYFENCFLSVGEDERTLTGLPRAPGTCI